MAGGTPTKVHQDHLQGPARYQQEDRGRAERYGRESFRFSGSENDLIKVKKLIPGYDLGFVGEVTSARFHSSQTASEDNIIPVIYPLG